MSRRRRRVLIESRLAYRKPNPPPQGAPAMTQAFAPEPTPSEPTLLIQAYELIDEPKPPLNRIVDLARAGDVSTTRDDRGIFWIADVDRFEDEVHDWCTKNNWNQPNTWNVLPAGYVTVVSWVRENVTITNGREKRIFDTQSPPQMTTYARDFLAAGDLESAMLCEGRIWAAKPSDIKAWLWRRFQIAVR